MVTAVRVDETDRVGAGYVYPGPQIFYGQSFMCMTLGACVLVRVARS
jgi:hypothetical protein